MIETTRGLSHHDHLIDKMIVNDVEQIVEHVKVQFVIQLHIYKEIVSFSGKHAAI